MGVNLLDNKELGENQPLVFMTRGHKSVSKALSLFFHPSLFLWAHRVKIENFYPVYLSSSLRVQLFSFLMYYEIEFTIFYIISKIQKLGELDIFSYLFKQYLGFGNSVYQWNTARQNSFTNETDTPFGHQKTRPYTLENTNVITILLRL